MGSHRQGLYRSENLSFLRLGRSFQIKSKVSPDTVRTVDVRTSKNSSSCFGVNCASHGLYGVYFEQIKQ